MAKGVHEKLWKVANRWRELAAQQAVELCMSRAEVAHLQAEAARQRSEIIAVRRELDEYRHSHP